MRGRLHAAIAVVVAIIYALAVGFRSTQVNIASLVGQVLIVGVATATVLEALFACWTVLTAPDANLGSLAQYRYQIAIGLVAGLIFAALTCLDTFGLIDVIGSSRMAAN